MYHSGDGAFRLDFLQEVEDWPSIFWYSMVRPRYEMIVSHFPWCEVFSFQML